MNVYSRRSVHTHAFYLFLSSFPLIFAALGCKSERAEMPAEFEPNLVHAVKYQIQKDFSMDQTSRDATWVVTKMFGTPDQPKLPDAVSADAELSSIVSEERLVRASGPVDAQTADGQGRGLFRKHCAVCHGVTGNGRGPTAAVQVPYPRDYRMGVFKFKSTPIGTKPTRADLARLIGNGIEGTAMKKIPELTEEDIESLVNYVIYLSWRGELERRIVDDAIYELDIEGGERILNTELATQLASDPELGEKLTAVLDQTDGEQLKSYEDYLKFDARLNENPKLKSQLKNATDGDESLAGDREHFEAYQEFAEQLSEEKDLGETLAAALKVTSGDQLKQYETYDESWGIIQDFAVEICQSWLDADREVLVVPEPPADIPLAESYADVVKFRGGDKAADFEASVKRGQELFAGKIAACNKCHGETGLGNGQTTDYDEWTKDWTTRIGLKPEDRDSLIPLLARGAFPPKNAIPRNFAEGVFHGGSSSEQLYRRITQGIDGTPMPAATFVEGQFEQRDVWHLINFIRSLQTAPEEVEQVKTAS